MSARSSGHAFHRHAFGHPALSLGRRVSLGLVVVIAGLVPWTTYLGVALPSHFVVRHWNVAWVGFDGALVLVLAYTAWAAWFRRRIVIASAIVAATLLVCDAWFDVVTSFGTRDEPLTIATALIAELPLAAFFVWLARQTIRQTDATFRSLLRQEAAAHELGEVPLPAPPARETRHPCETSGASRVRDGQPGG